MTDQEAKNAYVETENLVKLLANKLMNGQACSVCSGKGHNAKKCPFLRKMDKICKDDPEMRFCWGKLKSQKLKDGIEGRALIGVKRRRKIFDKNKGANNAY